MSKFTATMTNGTTFKDVEIIAADHVKYSITARKHNWPSVQEDPIVFMYFTAWNALNRMGKYLPTYDTFLNECASIDSQDGAEESSPSPF